MLGNSVGTKGVNESGDVKTVQQVINLRNDLRIALPKLVVDGKHGVRTQAAIDQIQSEFMRKPDGRIDPYGLTIKKMWPIAYALPTGLTVRGTDFYGDGAHGASRGNRPHDGTDYISTPEQRVKAPLSGKVAKISKPYSSGIDSMVLSGLEIEASDGTKCWVWYIEPSAKLVGTIVQAGINVIGNAKTLKNRYPNGMTDHVHVRIHDRDGTTIDPEEVIRLANDQAG